MDILAKIKQEGSVWTQSIFSKNIIRRIIYQVF